MSLVSTWRWYASWMQIQAVVLKGCVISSKAARTTLSNTAGFSESQASEEINQYMYFDVDVATHLDLVCGHLKGVRPNC